MTVLDEIRQAMEHGATPMFLRGLVAEHDRDPEFIESAINRAGFLAYTHQQPMVLNEDRKWVVNIMHSETDS